MEDVMNGKFAVFSDTGGGVTARRTGSPGTGSGHG
jgi:hypothetical protein